MLIATCTYLMDRFAAAHQVLQNISKGPLPNVLKLIALLLCVPCFKASNFFFKLAYLLN